VFVDVGYLRPVRSTESPARAESACVEAFGSELDYVFATLRRLGAAPREVEDLAQEVFVVLHKNWPAVDTTRPLRPYLFGIAFRVVSASRRRRTREVPYAALDAADDAVSPEGSLQSKESVRLVMAALEHVPLPRRVVIIMHDLDQVPVADIARTLSISRFGTYARLRKARKELKAAIGRLLKQGVPR
jgi:RNA polymerase sigma-70 factor (ECF subfamily)